jgi:hypothetical protein
MNTIIPANQVAQKIMEILDKVVAEEYPEEEREKAKVDILNSWSVSMFGRSMEIKE